MSSGFDISAFRARLNVSRETIERLDTYEQLLKKWTPKINLVASGSLESIWSRHFEDSAQLWLLKPKFANNWLDLGSGAGFPGLVIAVLAKELEPTMAVQLVESDVRKAAFLLTAAQEMGVSAKITSERAEILEPQNADVVSARALAPLAKLLEYGHRHIAKNGILLLPKGENHESELTEAAKYWKFELQKTPSVTNPGGVILEIGGLARV